LAAGECTSYALAALVDTLTTAGSHRLKSHSGSRLRSARWLAVRWARECGWIGLHDPLIGERHQVRASDCLPEVVENANRRRRKKGESS
jgi:hypothetical protein